MTITKEGSLASFYTVNKAPIKHLKVYFSPKQAGSGDPSPENIRTITGHTQIDSYSSGKNLAQLSPEILATDRTQAGITWHAINDTTVHISGKATGSSWITAGYAVNNKNFRTIQGGTYTISTNMPGPRNQNIVYIYGYKADSGATGISTFITNVYENNPGTFTLADGVWKIHIQMQIISTNITFDQDVWVQLEKGSTATVYEPHKNTNKIIEFPSQTKNLFDPTCPLWQTNAYTISGDQITQTKSDGRGWTQSDFIPIHLAAGTYTLTCSDGNVFNLRTSIDNYDSNTRLENGGGSFTLTQDCDVRFKHTASSYPTTFTVQLEQGSIATSYEPFYNTIYGGYVDLITGELIETNKKLILDGSSDENWWAYDTYDQYKGFALDNSGLKSGTRQVGYANWLPVTSTATANNLECWLGVNNTRIYCTSTASLVSTYSTSAWRAYLNENPLEIIIPLATPIVYQLTPQQLQTFIGQNNIWSNADRVEVEYDLAESNDELYRRRNIILQGAPHLESVSDNIANFNTDLVAPIKDAKIYFNPVQEGSGDPSPENIRPISGYSTMNIHTDGKNLLNPATYVNQNPYTIRGITFTLNEDGSVTANGTCNTKEVQVGFSWVVPFTANYYFCANIPVSFSTANVYIWDVTTGARCKKWNGTTQTNGSTVDGNLQEVQLIAGHTINFYCRVMVDQTVNNLVFKPMLLPSTCTDTTFEPYKGNIIPITFPAVGKNLFNKSGNTILDAYIYSPKIVSWSDTKSIYIQCIPNTTYTISKTAGQRFSVGYSKELPANNVELYNIVNNHSESSITYTTGSDAKYLVAFIYNINYDTITAQSMIDSVQIEYGSTATAYEPYNNMIYGGYIDLINEKIVQTHDSFTTTWGNYINGSTTILGNTERRVFDMTSTFEPREKLALSESYHFCNITSNFGEMTDWNTDIVQYLAGNSTLIVKLPINTSNDTIIQVVLKLKQPRIYQLTPQRLQTLKGTNNIWSNANGPVSISYWTH